MKSYSVRQIAEMLSTNPETVRRWIRDDKLKAEQMSRKEGNIVTEVELESFLRTSPKYFSRFAAGVGLMVMPPLIGISAFAGGIVASALLGYFEGNNNTKVHLEDFKNYLQKNIGELNETVEQKKALICRTQSEITEISKQIEQYTYLLEHEDLLITTLKNTLKNMEG